MTTNQTDRPFYEQITEQNGTEVSKEEMADDAHRMVLEALQGGREFILLVQSKDGYPVLYSNKHNERKLALTLLSVLNGLVEQL